MYVCLCNAVSDKQIAKIAREGVCCMRELRDRLGVGARCGKCVPVARTVLHAHAPARGASSACASDRADAALTTASAVSTVPVLAA